MTTGGADESLPTSVIAHCEMNEKAHLAPPSQRSVPAERTTKMPAMMNHRGQKFLE
jgi:hypothetical protein